MNYDIIITCAVTGSGDAAGKHPQLPKTLSFRAKQETLFRVTTRIV